MSLFIDISQSTETCPVSALYNVMDNGISEQLKYPELIVHVALFPIIFAEPYIYDSLTNEGVDPLVVFHVAVTVAESFGYSQ